MTAPRASVCIAAEAAPPIIGSLVGVGGASSPPPPAPPWAGAEAVAEAVCAAEDEGAGVWLPLRLLEAVLEAEAPELREPVGDACR
jgi:hypothetical protein